MLRPHPLQAPWATDLDTFVSGLRDLYIRASVLRVTSIQDAGQRYRGKLGNSPCRTSTDWAYGVTGCT